MQHVHAEFGFDVGFVLSENSSVTLPYARDKGALPWQPIFGQNRQNITKWPQLQLYAPIHAEFGFDIGFVLSGNSSVTLR